MSLVITWLDQEWFACLVKKYLFVLEAFIRVVRAQRFAIPIFWGLEGLHRLQFKG